MGKTNKFFILMYKIKNKSWVEKYRPKKLIDIVHQQEIVKTLTKNMKSGNLPHLLFYGPPGTGKTSTILACSKELFGPLFRNRVLELNASDERGINIIRTKIKTFSQKVIGEKKINGSIVSSFKILILDECDSLTNWAQNALRRMMEQYSKTTRFCLICNFVTRIITPLKSRCAKYRFQILPEQTISTILKEICFNEKFFLAEQSCKTLIQLSKGDMRKCINLLQSSKQLNDSEIIVDNIDILNVSIHISDKFFTHIILACEAPSFDNLLKSAEDSIANGLDITLILEQLCFHIACRVDINDKIKGKVCLSIARADSALRKDGADELLQLMKVLSVLFTMLKK